MVSKNGVNQKPKEVSLYVAFFSGFPFFPFFPYSTLRNQTIMCAEFYWSHPCVVFSLAPVCPVNCYLDGYRGLIRFRFIFIWQGGKNTLVVIHASSCISLRGTLTLVVSFCDVNFV